MIEYIVLSDLGNLRFRVDHNRIVGISFSKEPITPVALPDCVRMATSEIEQYLLNKRTGFSFPYEIRAKGFQLRVLKALQEIPYGNTVSYKELAEKTGNPRAYRAVAMACKRNPLMLVIPCHRVVRSDMTIGGYSGGAIIKQKILDLERR